MMPTTAVPAQRASGVRAKPSQARLIVATSIGNGLEIFDFTVYSFFAAMIGSQFFPSGDPITSLLFSVGTFGLGFLMRPLGAVLLGGYADRVGRRAAMTMTIWLMALGTALIGLCPPYASIGVIAPIIVLLGRLLQGFAAGGEVGAATTYLMESGPASRRGFYVSWQTTSQAAAALVGAGFGMVLSQSLPQDALYSWGWRIPFLVGLLVAPVGIYIRRALHDTHAGQSQPGTQEALPVIALLREQGTVVVLGSLLIMGGTVSLYTLVYYMPSYLTRVMHMPPQTGFMSATVSALVLLVMSPLSGLLADRLKFRKPLLLCTYGAMTALVMPVFLVVVHATPENAVLVVAAVAGFTAVMTVGGAAMVLMLLEAFPPAMRATGMALPYAIAVTFFGGTAQFVVTWLIDRTGNPLSAGWYVQACCIASFIALLAFRERKAAN